MKNVDPKEFNKEYKITYSRKPIPKSAWIQGNARILDAVFEENLPDWHISAYPKGRVDNPSEDSLIVYQDTMLSAMRNRKVMVEKARKPHSPVLPTNYSYLFYTITVSGLHHLLPIPESIYPHECWVVYGKQEDLATFKPEFPCENTFTTHVARVKPVAALKLAEYNPDVSFSYAYGNNMYSIKSAGYVSSNDLPDKTEYMIGIDDARDIIQEMRDDNLG